MVDHAALGAPGLVSIHGVRYTTARHTAAEAVDAVFRVLGPCRSRRRAAPTTRPLWGGAITRVADLRRRDAVDAGDPDVPPDTLTRLVRTYGTRVLRAC